MLTKHMWLQTDAKLSSLPATAAATSASAISTGSSTATTTTSTPKASEGQTIKSDWGLSTLERCMVVGLATFAAYLL